MEMLGVKAMPLIFVIWILTGCLAQETSVHTHSMKGT
jgi:hypothetical protein